MIQYNKNLKQKSRELRKNATLAEILLWKHLRGRNLRDLQFNRQKPIGNYIVDFYCKQISLVIEIDGRSHETKYEYDQAREQALTRMDLTVIRFTEEEVRHDLKSVLDRLDVQIEEMVKKKIPPTPFSRGSR